jgi:hypothetical protein
LRQLAIGLAALVSFGIVGCSAGPSCAHNSQCGVGRYCRAGGCVSDCSRASECIATHGAGATCNGFGMCVGGSDATVATDGSVDGGRDASLEVDAFVERDDGGTDGGVPVDMDGGAADAGTDAAGTDSGTDAASDAGMDVGPADGGPDAGTDGGRDAAAPPGTLFFSEYVEGTSNSKALEIFNGTASGVDLAAMSCTLREYVNGGVTPTYVLTLTGNIAPGDVFTICNSSTSDAIPTSSCDQRAGGATTFNGNDALELVCSGVTLDIIGQIGLDPGTEWGTGLTSTMDNTLRRQCRITVGDTNGGDAFDPSAEWDGFVTDTFDGLGSRGCP